MPLITSVYEDIPPWTGQNYHDIALGGPTVSSTTDYTLQIDGITGKKRTLRQFLDRIADGATALAAPRGIGGLGLKPSDGFVGIMSENCLVRRYPELNLLPDFARVAEQDYPVIIYALLKIAVPISLIPSLLTPTESATLIKLSCATTLFVSPRLLPLAISTAKKIGLPDSRIFVLGGRVSGRKSFSDLVASVRAQSIPRVATTPVKDDTVAYMVFSSGTGGLPKG